MTRDQMKIVRSNFCNLTDSTGRPIFSSSLAAQTPAMQQEWIAREKAAGGTHMVVSIQTGYTDYPPVINFYTEHRMPEWLTMLDRVLDAGLVPIVFLHSGGAYPGANYFRGVLYDIPPAYHPKCLWVSAWEPVRGTWTSEQFWRGSLAVREALGPDPIMACHLSQGRLSFSSHPVEADDPWHGDEVACWRENWGPTGHPFEVFLYQSIVPTTAFDPAEGWGGRAKECIDRLLGINGAPDWFAGIRRPTPIWFEATAFTFIRHASTSADACEVARHARDLGFTGFGNGLPAGGGSMWVYDEAAVFDTNVKVQACYAEAHQSSNEQSPIWIARTVFDACAGMPYSQSETKHLAELRQALGL